MTANPHATKNKRRSMLGSMNSAAARERYRAWQAAWDRGVREALYPNPCALTPLEYIGSKDLEDAFQRGFFGKPLMTMAEAGVDGGNAR